VICGKRWGQGREGVVRGQEKESVCKFSFRLLGKCMVPERNCWTGEKGRGLVSERRGYNSLEVKNARLTGMMETLTEQSGVHLCILAVCPPAPLARRSLLRTASASSTPRGRGMELCCATRCHTRVSPLRPCDARRWSG
jgi:hypothetical protein